MTFLNQDKPPLEEVIEHHGVKGMHWGQRRAAKKAAASHHHELFTGKQKVGFGAFAVTSAAGALWLNKQFTGHIL